jgi:hypothetical protein
MTDHSNQEKTPMRTAARAIFRGASWLLVAGLVVQVFLAGLGVFESPDRFDVHRDFGYTLEVLPVVMAIAGAAGGVGRRSIGVTALILGLFLVQSLLVAIRADAPMIAALHPLNGFLILLLSIVVARQSSISRGSTMTSAA